MCPILKKLNCYFIHVFNVFGELALRGQMGVWGLSEKKIYRLATARHDPPPSSRTLEIEFLPFEQPQICTLIMQKKMLPVVLILRPRHPFTVLDCF